MIKQYICRFHTFLTFEMVGLYTGHFLFAEIQITCNGIFVQFLHFNYA